MNYFAHLTLARPTVPSKVGNLLGDFMRGVLVPSETTSHCGWKGTANYYSINAGDAINTDAAFYYPEPLEAAAAIRDRIAFWKGVEVMDL